MSDKDERYQCARQLADVIAAKAEELSTALYEAHKMGYRTKLRVVYGEQLNDGCYLSARDPDYKSHAMQVRATVSFDMDAGGL